MRGKAQLRMSYIGGGYDFPEFFADATVRILAESLPLAVTCEYEQETVRWEVPAGLKPGLGSSAAKQLAYVRARFPDAPWRGQLDAAIALDTLQGGGWQDALVSGYAGLLQIVLHGKEWRVYPLVDMELVIASYRKLYEIPVGLRRTNILKGLRHREDSFVEMQSLVDIGRKALLAGDIETFGDAVLKGWHLKKGWHPAICNPVIAKMEAMASALNAWGWKVCGAGGQGYFLVIGPPAVHKAFAEEWTAFEID